MNSINLSTISDCYIGDTEANAIYFGSILVWQRKNNKVLCKYNVTNTNTSTKLFTNNIFSSMIVDDAEQEVVSSYTFDTIGEHTVLFTLKEGVTSIGNSAFYNCSVLTSITIGNSVTSIGNYAFNSCSGLTSITIPDSVTSIGDNAFYSCLTLTTITIPDSVTSIGNSVFSNCRELTSINVAANNQTYDSRNDCNAIIETSTNKLIAGCKNTIIPDSIISIGNYAFDNCYGLTSITIPNSVTSIYNNVFYNCVGLISVTIGNSVTSIGNYAFNSCSGLTNIICNATTAPTIQSHTFWNVKRGGTLTVPVGSTGYDVWMGTGNYYLGKYNWNKVEQ